MLSNCAKVLELGCGTGDSTVNFAPYTDLIFASDFSKKMIRIAAQKIAFSCFTEKIYLVLLDAQNIPFKNECFHGVFSRDALLNYITHPELLLEEIYRVLTSGGKLVLDIISRRSGGEANLYSKNQVEMMLKNAGFTSIDFRPMGMFLLLWQNRRLMNFVNEHRDIFCQIEVNMPRPLGLNTLR